MPTKVVVYTDFDGTITRRQGSKTVFSPFYQSLLKSPTKQYHLPGLLKSTSEVQELFMQKFGPVEQVDFSKNTNDEDILMDPEAVNFLHEILKESDVVVNIITRNRADYIQELLKYQGFSADEISRINIKDSGRKYDEVYNNLNKLDMRAEQIYIMDDDEKDYTNMLNATKDLEYEEQEIFAYKEPVGQFTWANYLKAIKSYLNSTKSVVTRDSFFNPSQKEDVTNEHSKENPLGLGRSN
ncbi:hypothetical protein ACNVED_08375 [Legionella sp. D16C41]|uniref:hypothetical protein n=1 Tax=Legionella sp. D16C41 TaxID=3402688 RepID=UPI003AF950E4